MLQARDWNFFHQNGTKTSSLCFILRLKLIWLNFIKKRAEKESSYNLLMIFLSLLSALDPSLSSLLWSCQCKKKPMSDFIFTLWVTRRKIWVRIFFCVMTSKIDTRKQSNCKCSIFLKIHLKRYQETLSVLPSVNSFHLTSLFQYHALSSRQQASFRAFTVHWVTLCFMRKESFFTFQQEIFCQMFFLLMSP